MGVGMVGIDLAEVFFKDGSHCLPHFPKDGFPFDPMVPLQGPQRKGRNRSQGKDDAFMGVDVSRSPEHGFFGSGPHGAQGAKKFLTASRKIPSRFGHAEEMGQDGFRAFLKVSWSISSWAPGLSRSTRPGLGVAATSPSRASSISSRVWERTKPFKMRSTLRIRTGRLCLRLRAQPLAGSLQTKQRRSGRPSSSRESFLPSVSRTSISNRRPKGSSFSSCAAISFTVPAAPPRT